MARIKAIEELVKSFVAEVPAEEEAEDSQEMNKGLARRGKTLSLQIF